MTRTGRLTEVDESLFGSSGARKGKSKTKLLMSPGAVIISRDDLERIKRNASLSSNTNSQDEADRIAKLEKARARTEKIRQLQAESLLREQQAAENSDAAVRARAVRETAQAKIDSTSEVVKLLTTMGARASAFKMREQQLQEKERRESVERKYEHRMDILMEIDRLKDITKREYEEKEKIRKRQEDRKVITQQMEERRLLQVFAAEARDQENQTMRNLMKKYQEDDARAAEQRKLEIEKTRTAVMKANDEAILKKKEEEIQARKEVEEILAYQLKRDMEKKKRAEEEAEMVRLKILRAKQLLEEQERVMTNNDKKEEIMARRFREEKERSERMKEKEARLKKQQEVQTLLQSREKSAEQKRQQQLLEKQMELLAIEAERRHAAIVEAREQMERKAKQDAAMQHRQIILQQMTMSEEQKRQERDERLAEGERLKQKERAEMIKLEAVRDKMVQDLAKQGVDTKYLSEMQTLNLHKVVYKS